MPLRKTPSRNSLTINYCLLIRQAKDRPSTTAICNFQSVGILRETTRMRIRLLPTLLLLPFFGLTQPDLAHSPRHSILAYAYRLTPPQAETLFRNDLYGWEKIPLPSPADSFPAGREDDARLKPGNYLIIYAEESHLQASLRTIGGLEHELLMNGNEAALVLHRPDGQPVTDAVVAVGKHAVPFDPVFGCYVLGRWKKRRIVRVADGSAVYFFPVERGSRRPVSRRYTRYRPTPEERFRQKWRSVFVLNKPKYKPGDTVSGKAFIMNRRGRPVRKTMALRLSDRGGTVDTLLQRLEEYRPGGYSFSFVLNDSLDLTLDEDYELSLGTAGSKQRKVYSSTHLHYEEYELSSIRLNARVDAEEQYRGEPLSVYLQALDENDLPAPDSRVELTVSAHSVSSFHGPVVFIKDILWQWSQGLDPVGETRIILPDSIFPAASLGYTLSCRLLSSDNEVDQKQFSINYHYDSARVVFRVRGDSLDIGYRRLGRDEHARAVVTAFTKNDDVIDSVAALLPATVRIPNMAASFKVTVPGRRDTLTGDYDLPDEIPAPPMRTRRTADTVEIVVGDSLHIPFWYTLMRGTRLIRRGYGENLAFRERAGGPEPYYFQLQYLWKGVLQRRTANLPFFEKHLNIEVREPRHVYPGQRVSVAVAVTDAWGRAVPGADVTAYAITAKFQEQSLPAVPYLGRSYRHRVPVRYAPAGGKQEIERTVALDWRRWRGVFGLDTLEYYRFLHPKTLYIHREPAPDGVTQFAPFVTRRGQPEPVYLMELDERLIFCDQAEQQRRYSFPASPGWHALRIRLSDRELRIDSFRLAPGMKTFLSINDDTANAAIVIRRMPDTLESWEKVLLRASLVTIRNNFAPHFATVRQGDQLYLLAPADRGTFLTGPLTAADALLEVKDGWKQGFLPEGGNQFIIRPGLIREKEWPSAGLFSQRLDSVRPLTGLGDRALTAALTDSLWQDWLDERSASQDLYTNERPWVGPSGSLQIGVPLDGDGKAVFVKKLFVFRHGDADFLHVFRGRTTQLGGYEQGVYRILLLLKGGRYFVQDSVIVRPNGQNYYSFDRCPVHAADSFSRRIAATLHQLEDQWVGPRNAGMDSLHFLFNDRYLPFAVFDRDASGVVTDRGGSPLAGVTVMIKGTRQATVTDAKGAFQLRIPARGTLVFAYIGYETAERSFSKSEKYTIRLNPITSSLSEVVVVGYGVQKKRSLSFSLTSVEGRVMGLEIKEAALEEQRLNNSAVGPGPIPPMPGLDTVRSIRRRFRDDAFWQPRLRTDEKGVASFGVVYPDDLTRWNTYFIAVTDRGLTGFAGAGVRSLKPLSARLSNPNFLIAGDSAFIIGKLLNYGSDTVVVNRRFCIGERVVAEGDLRFRNARIDTFLVAPGPRPDSVRFSYTLQRSDGYFDGEERSIPVLPAGTTETRGYFAPLEGDTSLQLHFDSALGPVHVHAEASLLPVLLDEIESIRRYEYLCNEQLASKLLALLQKLRVYRLEQREFKEDRNIREIIERLMKARGGKPAWGWWAEGPRIAWISLHVTQSLLAAEKEGYPTGLEKQPLIDFLVYNYESGKSFDRLFDLRLMQQLGARVDYRRYTDSALKYLDRRSLYETLRFMEICQESGFSTGLDTLVNKRQYTALGNCYWGEEGHAFFDNSIQTTTLMYRLLQKAGGYEAILRKTRNWLLERRGAGHWRNTYESSLILETLLPELLAGGGTLQSPAMTLNGNPIAEFPYQQVLPPGAGIQVQKTGPMPVYFTAYQQFLNPAPEQLDGIFEVRTRFEQDEETVEHLRSGKAATLVVEVEARADAEYVLVEAPIPAGCSYSEKEQSFDYQSIHSEYFKNKVSIFCQSLPRGKHVFRIVLMPRWTGFYRLNPARAELMYFPVLSGREGMKRMVIE